MLPWALGNLDGYFLFPDISLTKQLISQKIIFRLIHSEYNR